MLRIIIRVDDAGMAANVGGSVLSTFETFDIEAPHIEDYLMKHKGTYVHSQVIGAEIVEKG